MGLDMYLRGERYYRYEKNPKDSKGRPIRSEEIDLGYWRKHPNLHGYIVKTFAEGVDECQRIPLDKDNLLNIKQAVIDNNLPDTTGFFFGSSPKPGDEYFDETKTRDLHIIEGAIAFLDEADTDDAAYRSVYYQSSW